MAYYNPFQNRELRFPEKYKDEIEGYCQTRPSGGKPGTIDDSPFPRQVDLWFLSVCLGAQKNMHKKEKKSYRFITGEILANDPYKIQLLEILGISQSNDPYIISKPREIMNLANEYAAAGIEELIDIMKNGKEQSLGNLTNYFHNKLKTN